MIQCNCCNLQYIGKTKGRLKDRYNEHCRTVDDHITKSKPNTVTEPFCNNGVLSSLLSFLPSSR